MSSSFLASTETQRVAERTRQPAELSNVHAVATVLKARLSIHIAECFRTRSHSEHVPNPDTRESTGWKECPGAGHAITIPVIVMAAMKLTPKSADKILRKALHADADDSSEHEFHTLVPPREEDRPSSAAQVHRRHGVSRAVDVGHRLDQEERRDEMAVGRPQQLGASAGRSRMVGSRVGADHGQSGLEVLGDRAARQDSRSDGDAAAHREVREAGRHDEGLRRPRQRDVLARKAVTALVVLACLGAGLAAAAQGNADVKTLKNPVASTPESIAAGQQLYLRHCASCHGRNGQGGPGNDLIPAAPSLLGDKWDHGSTDGEIFTNIRNGVAPDFNMVPFKDKLKDDEIRSIVLYVRSLKK